MGLSLCKEYLDRGWNVFAGKYLDDHTFLEDMRSKNNSLHIIKLDMGQQESITAAKEEIFKSAGSLDMLISNAAFMEPAKCSLFETPMDLEAVWDSFRINALGPLRLVESLMPIFEHGGMKRLCFVSSEVSSITLMKHRSDIDYPYPMSKASLNMGVRLLHNQLYKHGYTFRLFHPGWMKRRMPDGSLSEYGLYSPDYISSIAAMYFEAPLHDEHRLVMVDFNGYEWPF